MFRPLFGNPRRGGGGGGGGFKLPSVSFGDAVEDDDVPQIRKTHPFWQRNPVIGIIPRRHGSGAMGRHGRPRAQKG